MDEHGSAGVDSSVELRELKNTRAMEYESHGIRAMEYERRYL